LADAIPIKLLLVYFGAGKATASAWAEQGLDLPLPECVVESRKAIFSLKKAVLTLEGICLNLRAVTTDIPIAYQPEPVPLT
jgi:hypothetical protein